MERFINIAKCMFKREQYIDSDDSDSEFDDDEDPSPIHCPPEKLESYDFEESFKDHVFAKYGLDFSEKPCSTKFETGAQRSKHCVSHFYGEDDYEYGNSLNHVWPDVNYSSPGYSHVKVETVRPLYNIHQIAQCTISYEDHKYRAKVEVIDADFRPTGLEYPDDEIVSNSEGGERTLNSSISAFRRPTLPKRICSHALEASKNGSYLLVTTNDCEHSLTCLCGRKVKLKNCWKSLSSIQGDVVGIRVLSAEKNCSLVLIDYSLLGESIIRLHEQQELDDDYLNYIINVALRRHSTLKKTLASEANQEYWHMLKQEDRGGT